MTDSRHEIPVRIDIDGLAPRFSRAMGGLDLAATEQWDAAGLDPVLRDLVRLRVSQLNGCAYCVQMHSTDARGGGASEGRIAAVAVWNESPFFSGRERAAFALAEQIALVSQTHVPDPAWTAAATVFTEQELAAIVAVAVTISAWNGIAVATRAWTPAE